MTHRSRLAPASFPAPLLAALLLGTTAACRGGAPTEAPSESASAPGSTEPVAAPTVPPTQTPDASSDAAEPGPPTPAMPRVLVDSLPPLAAPDAATCSQLEDALTQVQPYAGGSVDFEPFLADLASADVRVRASALARVEGVGGESLALVDPLLAIAGSGDANARLRALELLTRIDAGRAITAASDLLQADGGRQVRMIAASSLARSGDTGLTALLPALTGSDQAIRREAYAALPRAAAYPLAALRRLFGPAAPCAQLDDEGCRALARSLAVGDAVAVRAAFGDSPQLELLLAEARADVDADALQRWSTLVADASIPIGLVRDSVIELRLRGLTTELAPAMRRLLAEPAVLGPRTVGGLLTVAPALSDAGDVLQRCIAAAENLDVAATCAATRAAIGQRELSADDLARMESILAQSAPAHALSGRLAAMVVANAGAMRADSPWVGRFDMAMVELLRAMAAGDVANVAGAINNAALDDRTAIRAGVLFSVSRGSALVDAYAALAEPLASDARWLEIAAVGGATWQPQASRLAGALTDAQPSSSALHWLHAAGQTQVVADWIERALASGDYVAVHAAVLTARRTGLLVDPTHLVTLLTHRGAEARVETAAYRLDIARLLVEQGGADPALLLAERTRVGDGAPGFPELGIAAMKSLALCR